MNLAWRNAYFDERHGSYSRGGLHAAVDLATGIGVIWIGRAQSMCAITSVKPRLFPRKGIVTRKIERERRSRRPDFNSIIVEHARKDFPLLDAKRM